MHRKCRPVFLISYCFADSCQNKMLSLVLIYVTKRKEKKGAKIEFLIDLKHEQFILLSMQLVLGII